MVYFVCLYAAKQMMVAALTTNSCEISQITFFTSRCSRHCSPAAAAHSLKTAVLCRSLATGRPRNGTISRTLSSIRLSREQWEDWEWYGSWFRIIGAQWRFKRNNWSLMQRLITRAHCVEQGLFTYGLFMAYLLTADWCIKLIVCMFVSEFVCLLPTNCPVWVPGL